MFLKELKKLENKWLFFKFLITFLIFSIPFYIILNSSLNLKPLQKIVASQVNWLLNFFGIDTSLNSEIIILPLETGILKIIIIRECTGWISLFTFSGLIIASPKRNKKIKIIGLLLGLPIIWFFNILRLFTTFYITSIKGLNLFEVMHSLLWKIFSILFILFLWGVWFNISKKYIENRNIF